MWLLVRLVLLIVLSRFVQGLSNQPWRTLQRQVHSGLSPLAPTVLLESSKGEAASVSQEAEERRHRHHHHGRQARRHRLHRFDEVSRGTLNGEDFLTGGKAWETWGKFENKLGKEVNVQDSCGKLAAADGYDPGDVDGNSVKPGWADGKTAKTNAITFSFEKEFTTLPRNLPKWYGPGEGCTNEWQTYANAEDESWRAMQRWMYPPYSARHTGKLGRINTAASKFLSKLLAVDLGRFEISSDQFEYSKTKLYTRFDWLEEQFNSAKQATAAIPADSEGGATTMAALIAQAGMANVQAHVVVPIPAQAARNTPDARVKASRVVRRLAALVVHFSDYLTFRDLNCQGNAANGGIAFDCAPITGSNTAWSNEYTSLWANLNVDGNENDDGVGPVFKADGSWDKAEADLSDDGYKLHPVGLRGGDSGAPYKAENLVGAEFRRGFNSKADLQALIDKFVAVVGTITDAAANNVDVTVGTVTHKMDNILAWLKPGNGGRGVGKDYGAGRGKAALDIPFPQPLKQAVATRFDIARNAPAFVRLLAKQYAFCSAANIALYDQVVDGVQQAIYTATYDAQVQAKPAALFALGDALNACEDQATTDITALKHSSDLMQGYEHLFTLAVGTPWGMAKPDAAAQEKDLTTVVFNADGTSATLTSNGHGLVRDNFVIITTNAAPFDGAHSVHDYKVTDATANTLEVEIKPAVGAVHFGTTLNAAGMKVQRAVPAFAGASDVRLAVRLSVVQLHQARTALAAAWNNWGNPAGYSKEVEQDIAAVEGAAVSAAQAAKAVTLRAAFVTYQTQMVATTKEIAKLF